MQLVNEFVVPRGVDETWAVLTDVERIAPAMPGAQLTSVEDGKYSGTVKVKVGPVTAAYAGVASFRELDQANHHMTLDATGKESSGRGRAAAVVSADLVPEGDQTRVKVTTDLTISGPLAQFGRGAIAEVSTRLLNQFVANLKAMVLADTTAPPVAEAGAASTTPIAAPATDLPASAATSAGDAPPATPDSATPAASTPEASTRGAGTSDADARDASTPEAGSPDVAGPTSAGPDATGPAGAPIPAQPVPTEPASAQSTPAQSTPAQSTPAQATPAQPSQPAPPTLTRPAPAAAEVNLLRVAAWPILKRLIPVAVLVIVIVVLIVWLV